MKSDPVWVVNLYLYSESDTLLNFNTVERRLEDCLFDPKKFTKYGSFFVSQWDKVTLHLYKSPV